MPTVLPASIPNAIYGVCNCDAGANYCHLYTNSIWGLSSRKKLQRRWVWLSRGPLVRLTIITTSRGNKGGNILQFWMISTWLLLLSHILWSPNMGMVRGSTKNRISIWWVISLIFYRVSDSQVRVSFQLVKIYNIFFSQVVTYDRRTRIVRENYFLDQRFTRTDWFWVQHLRLQSILGGVGECDSRRSR